MEQNGSYSTNQNQPPQYQSMPPFQQNLAPVMTIGQWVVTMLLMIIPFVNIVMLIVWAVSSGENPNRSNWAKAQLIFMVIGIVLWFVLAGAIIGAMGSLGNMMQ